MYWDRIIKAKRSFASFSLYIHSTVAFGLVLHSFELIQHVKKGKKKKISFTSTTFFRFPNHTLTDLSRLSPPNSLKPPINPSLAHNPSSSFPILISYTQTHPFFNRLFHTIILDSLHLSSWRIAAEIRISNWLWVFDWFLIWSHGGVDHLICWVGERHLIA